MNIADHYIWFINNWCFITPYEREVLSQKIEALRRAEEALESTMKAFSYRLALAEEDD